MGFLSVESDDIDRRESTAASEDIRFMTDWNMDDTFVGGERPAEPKGKSHNSIIFIN